MPSSPSPAAPASRDASAAFARLFEIVRRLRAPDGCPWDREQTPQSLRPSLLEEAWEAVSAIDAGDDLNLREELGDIFLIVTMMAWMREEAGSFSVKDALEGISEKLVRRHPHVFGAEAGEAGPTPGSSPSVTSSSTPAEVLRQWDQIKAAEHAAGGTEPSAPSALGRVARSLPPLERAYQLQKKAAKAGFDWPGPGPVWEKIEEELRELRSALSSGDRQHIEEEAGDVLFSVVNLARLLHMDPGVALHAANAKFERRFREMEKRLAASGIPLAQAGMNRMDAEWESIKGQESAAGSEPKASK
jgi:tetrapyrrole methylase family protein/MazG family protein